MAEGTRRGSKTLRSCLSNTLIHAGSKEHGSTATVSENLHSSQHVSQGPGDDSTDGMGTRRHSTQHTEQHVLQKTSHQLCKNRSEMRARNNISTENATCQRYQTLRGSPRLLPRDARNE
jgi:hypothetical protein